MAYIPLLRMRVKTEVQSVIAHRRSDHARTLKIPTLAPIEGRCRLHLHTQHARPSPPSPRLLSAILPLVFGLVRKTELTDSSSENASRTAAQLGMPQITLLKCHPHRAIYFSDARVHNFCG